MKNLPPVTAQRAWALQQALGLGPDEVMARAIDTLFAALRPPVGDTIPAPPPSEYPEEPMTAYRYHEAQGPLGTMRRTAKPKVKLARSTAYLKFVREHRCCVCGDDPATVEAHHHGKKGMGQKGSDFTCIPLCYACHEAFHHSGHFPEMTRRQTDDLAKRTQKELLAEWGTP